MVRGGSHPPKWQPRGMVKSRGAQRNIQTISVLQCWAQKAAQGQQNTRQQRPNEAANFSADPVILDDSTDEFDVQPTNSAEHVSTLPGIPRQFPKSSTKTTKKLKLQLPTSETLLKERCADLTALREMHFSIGEITREWEREAVKAAANHNVAISIPYDTSGAHIVATLFYNFLRWFPEGRCLCTTILKTDYVKALRERCEAVGIPANEFTEVDNVTGFKKLKPHQISRLLVGSPQTLTKICESSPQLASSFCCIVLNFESPSETATKYKKLIDAVKKEVVGQIFRTVVISPRHMKSQVKGSALTTRQILITNLGLSDWLQFGPTDPTFRAHHVSPRVGVEYWDQRETVTCEDSSWADIWRETSRDLLRSLARDVQELPSVDPDELFYADWSLITEAAKKCSASAALLAFSSHFVVQAYRHLRLGGPRVFYLYCHHILNSPTNEALQLQTVVASNEGFHNVYEDIGKKYSYSIENPYAVGYKEESMKSHPKWIQLRKNIGDFIFTGGPIKGVILCDGAWNARVAAESINGIGQNSTINVTIVHAVINENLINDVAFRPLHKTLQGIPHLFQRTGSTIAIIRVDLPLVMNVLDQIAQSFPQFIISTDRNSLCWLPLHTTEHAAMLSYRYEKLRPSDGHLPNEFALNDTAARYEAISIYDKFDFDYHTSPLFLDTGKIAIREYFRLLDNNQSCNEKYQLTEAEKVAYERMALGTFPKPTRTRPSIGNLTDDMLYWNKLDHSFYGKISSSKLSQRWLKQMTADNFSLTPAEFQYDEDPSAIEKQKNIDSLLAQLQQQFVFPT